MIIKARYVVSLDGPVIEDGAVVVQDGIIVSVGPARDVGDAVAMDFGEVIDHGDAVIVPGFVNAHTHLELSMLAGLIPPSADFPNWLARLVSLRRNQQPGENATADAVGVGLTQSLLAGVTLVGDITSAPLATRQVLAGSPLRAVSFGEVIAIGALRDQFESKLAAALDARWSTPRMRIGLSPHAPYTVEPDQLATCASRAASVPLCIHLAETVEEELFTRECSGPLAKHLRSLGVWDDSIPVSGYSPVELADRVGLLTDRTVIAHANYASEDDIRRIARSGASVAYCPRTHHAFEHSPHPFKKMMAIGVNVCIGTDSLASNPSLSVLDELRFLRSSGVELEAVELLSLGTINGAKALGLGHMTGSLQPGKLADIAVVPISASDAAPWESIFTSSDQPIATYVAGASVGRSMS